MNVYNYGERVRISSVFLVSGTATDPSTVTLKVQSPDLVEASYTYAGADITKDATGKYHMDLTVDQAGIWTYRWEGTGAVVSADEDCFRVRETEFDV